MIVRLRTPKFRLIHQCHLSRIPVPCGYCASCVHLKQVSYVQRVQMEALNHDLFYGTLTYNPQSIPVKEYDSIKFAYPDISDWQKMIKMIRKDYPDLSFKYMLVSEYGSKKHRPHYHFLLSLPKTSNKLAEKIGKAYDLFTIFLRYWRRNYGSTRVPIWKPLLTYKRTSKHYNFDLHYLDPTTSVDGLDGVSFYVTKYLLKHDPWVLKFKAKLFHTLEESEYKDAWSHFRPRVLLSKGFGSPDDESVKAYIKRCINLSLSSPNIPLPMFFSRQNGSTYPLAQYYKRRFLTVDDAYVFAQRRPEFDVNNFEQMVDIDKFDKEQIKFNLVKSFLHGNIQDFDLEDMIELNDEIFDYYETKRPSDGSEFDGSYFETDFSDLPPDNVYEAYLADSSLHRPNTFTWQYSLFDD